MPALTESDTIRILVATDSHVGYGERDPIRKDDSWRSFDEVMTIAKERDVDMVLMAGDLFHDNKPSRQALYQVMRSLRMNCLGEKPCELEMLSDKTENFEGAFNHVNYEDPDINVAIPVFSIHGNHDDPTGESHLASLDLLQIGGLVNYYGRAHESDNVQVKPVLLQKGRTKLALYGLSNIRDERLHRTWRDGNVRFFKPSARQDEWFNIMSVHQNRHAYTETSYLPEAFIPNYMDLVIWGHEHECIIHPQKNPETGFHVIQPGSSIATSLVAGEAVPKHVCILSITGKELKSEPIRLKTVRPFVTRDISLAEDSVAKKLAKKENHRVELTRRLEGLVNELIEEAKTEWYDAQDEEDGDEDREPPLPLIRLRVDHSAPDGGSFDIENPQRFSNRFVGKVANANDVIQYQKKKAASSRRGLNGAELPDASKLAEFDQLDSVKVDMLVQEFLMAQTLSVLPQSGFGDAVTQFVDKDDKHAMELFVNDSLKSSVEYLQVMDWEDDDELQSQLEANRDRLDKDFQAGHRKRSRPVRLKPKPEEWNSDIDGEWGDQPGAIIRSDLEDEEDSDDVAPTGRGSAARRGRGGNTAAAKRTTAAAAQKAAPSKAPTKAPARGSRRAQVDEDSEDEEAFDPMVIDDDDDGGAANDQSQGIFVDDEPTPPTRGKGSRGGRGGSRGGKAATTKTPAKAPAKKAAPAKKSAPAKATPAMSQSSLKSWAGSGTGTGTSAGRAKTRQVVEDASDDDEDEDAFEPAAATRGKGRR